MNALPPDTLTLAVYPTSRGYAFVLFEGTLSPYDWGISEVRGKEKNARIVADVERIIGKYRPDTLVIENASEQGSRRAQRIRRLYRALLHLAETEHVDVFQYPRTAVRACFAPIGARTKYEIAQAIARQVPALLLRLPRARKAWMSEDPRQSLYDAAALGLTHFATMGRGSSKGASPAHA